MLEDLIAHLDSLGVTYEEDYEAGTLTIPVDAMDKVQLIDVIIHINGVGLPFTIDETSLIVTIQEEPEFSDMEGELSEEVAPEEDMNQVALDQMFG